jgi:hypothetical protein
MYLLGSAKARGRIHGTVECLGERAITVALDGGHNVISGVYMPPSLGPDDVRATLDHLTPTSTIILGDINTRFQDKTHQLGAPRPSNRLAVFVDFLSQQCADPFFHVKPSYREDMDNGKKKNFRRQLTTNHCFVK